MKRCLHFRQSAYNLKSFFQKNNVPNHHISLSPSCPQTPVLKCLCSDIILIWKYSCCVGDNVFLINILIKKAEKEYPILQNLTHWNFEQQKIINLYVELLFLFPFPQLFLFQMMSIKTLIETEQQHWMNKCNYRT